MKKKSKKIRIDKLLVDLNFVQSCCHAQALIMAGKVLVDDVPVTKAGQLVDPEGVVRIKGEDIPYVSRGGLKLERALKEFGCDVRDEICMDVGASTGGFTDCLLQNGASKVYAVDVGYGQLDWRIANDERVVVIDRTNIRHIDSNFAPEPIGVIVIDVSFISLELVLPVVDNVLVPGGTVIALIKPQFEVGKELVEKGGIVKDTTSHEWAIEKVKRAGMDIGWKVEGVVESPIKGAKGNKEFLIHFRK